MATKYWMIGGLAVAAAAGGTWWTLKKDEKPPEKVTVQRVHRASVTKRVRGVGHVEPVTQVHVSANISGDLLKLYVTDGARVLQGQMLAEIDREQLAAIVRQNEANTRSQVAAVAVEHAQLVQAQAEEKRTIALRQQNLVPDAEVEKMRSNVAMIEARLEAAKQRALQSEASLDEAKSRLGKTRVTAPIDGTIISLKKKVGEKIRGSDLAEDILLVLAPLHAMQVQVEVTEQDVVALEIGQAAEVTVDALGEKPSVGKVVEIANSAIIRNQGLETETTSFAVKVALEEIPTGLRSGMSASVAIATQTKDDVIAVPIESVTARLPSQLTVREEEEEEEQSDEEKKREERVFRAGKKEKAIEVVFVVEGGKAKAVKVTTGLFSDTEIEIVDGLSEGAEQIIGPYKALARTLRAGMVVEVLREPSETKPSERVASEQ